MHRAAWRGGTCPRQRQEQKGRRERRGPGGVEKTAPGTGDQGRFLSRSRISVRSFSCVVGSGGRVGFAPSWRLSAFMPFTSRKMQKATMRKFRVMVAKSPH